MQEDKIKLATFGDEAHKHIRDAVDVMESAVGSTYGPGGRPMLLKKRYVDPTPSTDGVAVARSLAGFGAKFEDDRATSAAKLIYQASEKTNKTAGDGTTATVVLLGELYKSGRKQIVAGTDAMHVKKQIDDAREKITEFVEGKSVECDKKKLIQVATIAGKDEALGHMLADLVWDVGTEGAITIEYQNAPSVDVEKVTGYLLNNGFKNLANEVQFEEPVVFVSQKRIATKSEIVPILEAAVAAQKQFVIVGDVSGAAYETLVWAISNQKADGLCVPPPAFGSDGHDYFEDIATYTGARLWLESDNFKDVKIDDFGTIKRSRISRDKAILFGDDNHVINVDAVEKSQQLLRNVEVALVAKREELESLVGNEAATLEEKASLEQHRRAKKVELGNLEENLKVVQSSVVAPITVKDAVTDRIKQIDQQIKKQEMTPSLKEVLETRRAKLAGKVSIVKVGAATEMEREELFFRVEDAVEASKSALSSGIVAGGATTLLFASEEVELPQFIKEALQEPFRLLMKNAAYRADLKLDQTLKAGYGHGFNLRDMTDEPINLIEAGVVDATKVVLQTVKNAFSVAGGLLSTGGTITEVEDEKTDSKN